MSSCVATSPQARGKKLGCAGGEDARLQQGGPSVQIGRAFGFPDNDPKLGQVAARGAHVDWPLPTRVACAEQQELPDLGGESGIVWVVGKGSAMEEHIIDLEQAIADPTTESGIAGNKQGAWFWPALQQGDQLRYNVAAQHRVHLFVDLLDTGYATLECYSSNLVSRLAHCSTPGVRIKGDQMGVRFRGELQLDLGGQPVAPSHATDLGCAAEIIGYCHQHRD
jgi:hypothetical protein